jgi:type I site-specific restriction-modification system R (restriction) subunit
VEETERAAGPDGDQKIDVIWHTQDAGKSLSMVFLVGILRQRLGNPAILIEVDRNDLDEQPYDAFVAAKPLIRSSAVSTRPRASTIFGHGCRRRAARSSSPRLRNSNSRTRRLNTRN